LFDSVKLQRERERDGWSATIAAMSSYIICVV
jgi:hypothetical protein